jgi:hypothetical protein
MHLLPAAVVGGFIREPVSATRNASFRRDCDRIIHATAFPLIFAPTVRPIAVPDGIVMVTYGACESFHF